MPLPPVDSAGSGGKLYVAETNQNAEGRGLRRQHTLKKRNGALLPSLTFKRSQSPGPTSPVGNNGHKNAPGTFKTETAKNILAKTPENDSKALGRSLEDSSSYEFNTSDKTPLLPREAKTNKKEAGPSESAFQAAATKLGETHGTPSRGSNQAHKLLGEKTIGIIDQKGELQDAICTGNVEKNTEAFIKILLEKIQTGMSEKCASMYPSTDRNGVHQLNHLDSKVASFSVSRRKSEELKLANPSGNKDLKINKTKIDIQLLGPDGKAPKDKLKEFNRSQLVTLYSVLCEGLSENPSAEDLKQVASAINEQVFWEKSDSGTVPSTYILKAQS